MRDHFDRHDVAEPATGTLPGVHLLDVTLRDGGFETDFHWPSDVLMTHPPAVGPVGVDVDELGYLGGVPLEHGVAVAGVGAHLRPEHLAAARFDGVRLAAMVHPTALDSGNGNGGLDVDAYADAGLDLLRLVYHPDWLDPIARLAARAHDAGLRVSVNIALASRYRPGELAEHAARIANATEPDVLYVADTCGALDPTQVTGFVAAVRAVTDVPVGFHAHDFLSFGYANALAAVAAGARWLDVSVLGLGRGGGNLSAELVLARHRFPGEQLTGRLELFLSHREQLAELADRPVPDLVPMVCGVLNLTPVEEQALRTFAAEDGIDLQLAALWLVAAYGRVPSLHVDGLRAGWLAEAAPVVA
ncbi:hypothetical protein ACQEVZ_55040 [Dactylosporangium sp. CA-152071]|uniref:hypothetical protein n=1 Tax=Dactylosporangium sp. CA-152071 TaxID=3239933 RepID=UPI003D8D004A